MEKAGDLLKKYLIENGFNNRNLDFKIFRDWEFIIGKKIYGHSRIIDIIDHVLIIEVDHPGWLQIMTLKEKEILKKIGQKYPELEIKHLKYQLKLEIIKTNNNLKIKNNIKNIDVNPFKTGIQNIKNSELKNSLNNLYNCVLNSERRVDKNDKLE